LKHIISLTFLTVIGAVTAYGVEAKRQLTEREQGKSEITQNSTSIGASQERKKQGKL
jgi:hypothetical protein